jgi:transposase InsO family protein
VNARGRAAFVLAALCLVGVALVIAPLPIGARAAIVLPVALVAPGVAVTRTLGLRDPVVEVVLAFPISAALCILTAQASLYLDTWSPTAGMVLLLAGSGVLLWRNALAPAPRDAPPKTQGDMLFAPHLGVFALAKELGNVSAACRAMGVDRSTYYRWKQKLDGSGLDHIDAFEPGERVQLDCFYLGRLAGTGGLVWQYTAADVASGFAWAELHPSQRNPRARWTRALLQRVARELKATGSSLQEVTTDSGPEFRAREFSEAVERLGARQRLIKADGHNASRCVRRLQRTILEECWCPFLARSVVPNVAALQRELDAYLDSLNLDPALSGRVTNGHTPADIALGGGESLDGGWKHAAR